MKVNLFVSARKLPDMDVFSKSDPQCIIYLKNGRRWQQIGKTEKINDNLNPDWRTSFTMPYYFERRQDLLFKIIDDDGEGEEADFLGQAEVTMG